MYQSICKKCGSISLHTEVKGNNTGLYCDDCGAWVKWLGKDELRAFEHSQIESNKLSNKNITARLKEFVEFLEKKIDSEYEYLIIYQIQKMMQLERMFAVQLWNEIKMQSSTL